MKYFKKVLIFFIVFISMFILCYFIPTSFVNKISSSNFDELLLLDQNQIKYMMDYGYENDLNNDFFKNVITLDGSYTRVVVNTQKYLVLFVAVLLTIIDILLVLLFYQNNKLKYSVIISSIVLILFNAYYIINTFNGFDMLVK